MKRVFLSLLSSCVSAWSIVKCLSYDCIWGLLVLGIIILVIISVFILCGTLKNNWILPPKYLLIVAMVSSILIFVSCYGIYINKRYANNLPNIVDPNNFIPKPDSLLLVQGIVKNDLYAQKRLSEIYYKGDGVNLDFTQSNRFMQLADAQEDPLAAVNLGMMYYNGQGVKTNYLMAYSYFKKALLRGNIAFKHVYYMYDMLQKELIPPDSVTLIQVYRILDNYNFLNNQIMIQTCDFDDISNHIDRIVQLADEGYLDAAEKLCMYYSYIGNRTLSDKYNERAVVLGSTHKFIALNFYLKRKKNRGIPISVDSILKLPMTGCWRLWFDLCESRNIDIFDQYKVAKAIVLEPETNDKEVIRKDKERLFRIQNQIKKEIASKLGCFELDKKKDNRQG